SKPKPSLLPSVRLNPRHSSKPDRLSRVSICIVAHGFSDRFMCYHFELSGSPEPALPARNSMPNLAARMSRARPSAIMAVAEKAKHLTAEGRDIGSFSIGVPNFLPGEHVYAAAREALSHDSGQYGSNRGSDALLDAFLTHLEGSGLEGYARRNVA